MPHLPTLSPAAPPLIDAEPGLRALLRRADDVFDLSSLRSVEPVFATPLLLETTPPCHPAAWASAVQEFADEARRIAPAFALGFTASMTMALMVLAASPLKFFTTPLLPVEMARPATRIAGFAAPQLPPSARIAPSFVETPGLKVAGEIEAEVDPAVPFRVDVEVEQWEASIRIGALPTATPAQVSIISPEPPAPVGVPQVVAREMALAMPQPDRESAATPVPTVAKAPPVRLAPEPKSISVPKVAKGIAKPARNPAKPVTEEKVATARATKPKTADRRPPSTSMPVMAVAPPPVVSPGQALPWSYRWMRSSLGMGQSGQ